MFDRKFEFRYCTNRIIEKGELVFKEHKLSFICNHNHRYIVNVEEHQNQVFVIKFHLKAHSNSKQKYNLLTGHLNGPSVIVTCIHIMIFFYRKNPFSSFGFIGAELDGENPNYTKRLKLYEKLMKSFFRPTLFAHYINKQHSAYLLLNKDNQEPQLAEKVTEYFTKHYVLNAALHQIG